jgi:hypothetical protein
MTRFRTKTPTPRQAEFELRRLLAADAKIARARARQQDKLVSGPRRDQTRIYREARRG